MPEFAAVHEGIARAAPEAVWALWEDPARWREWNPEIVEASTDGPLARGSTATIRFRRGRPLTFTVLEWEPGRVFTDETAFPGARMGHEHRVEPGPGGGARFSHRLYLRGPLARVYALVFGRRMKRDVRAFVERELATLSAS